MLQAGIKGKQQVTVSEKNSARTMGSGTLDVFATPAMVALMEETCWKSVQDELEEGQGTVGIHLDIAHSAATPLGMTVRCETELVEIDRRKLVFAIEVHDGVDKVAEGRHERFIVDNAKFLSKAESKS